MRIHQYVKREKTSITEARHRAQNVIVQAMLKPETYPHPIREITHLQTYISHIFLTGDLVYKIKKPVHLDFLDFTTLAKRCYFCHQEVTLNRRLARDIYLGVVKITNEKGRPVINGKGPVLDYAVQMKEMPQDRMMNRLLTEGKVRDKDIRDLVRILVPFYQQAKTGKGINPFGRIAIWTRNIEENFSETLSFVGRLVSRRTYNRIIQGTRKFLNQEKPLFNKRRIQGYIRDCHGDLHSANICLGPPPRIYDCIEFNHRFRYLDVACDLSFLAMDLDFHGRVELSALLQKEYVRLSGDQDLPLLFDFYKGYRAYVRAKIHSLTSEDSDLSTTEKKHEIKLAKQYYKLADQYIQKGQTPRLWVFFGLMGSGKTFLAKALAAETGWSVISSDEVRKHLQGLSPTTRRLEPFGRGIYSEEKSRKTYSAMRKMAEKKLREGQSIIMDGSYKRQAERLALMKVARKTGARICFIECQAPLKTIRQRLEERKRDLGAVSDGRWELFNRQRRDFDHVVDPVLSRHLVIKTNRPPFQIIATLKMEILTDE
jgi:uncharacterized protein